MDREHVSEGVQGPGWREALPAIIAIFLASRLLLFLVVAVVEFSLPLAYDRPTYSTAPILGGLTGHDAIYYLGIAAEGYHLGPVSGQYYDWVFFPLFPLVTRLVSVFTLGDVALAGVLVANAALLLGLVLIHRIVRLHLDARQAIAVVVLVAFAPGAVAFGMAYSDSLLLACGAGAMLAASRRRYLLMGVLFGLAVLCRPPGILFGLPLLAALVAADGRRPRPGWLALAIGPLALVAFAAYQGAVLGDPLAFIRGQPAWNIPPAAGPGAAPGGVGSVAPLVVLLLGTLLAYTAMLPGVVRSRMPRAQVLVALVAFATVFLSGRLQSDARYLAIGWPFAWMLAERRGLLATSLIPGISAALYLLYAFLHVTQVLAP